MSPPVDLLATAEDLAALFDDLGISYALGGAVAQNYWGTVRATQDIDLLAAVARIRFEDLARELRHRGYHAKDAGGIDIEIDASKLAKEERESHLFTFYRGLVKVEVFLPFLPLQHSILRRAVLLPLGARQARITTAEDLIVLKLAFGREKDIRDVKGMLWSQRGKLDLAYVREWAGRMLPADRLGALEEWIGKYGT